MRAISNHAFGLAIDIEYPTNPMLSGSSAKAIDELLVYLRRKGNKSLTSTRKRFQGAGNISMENYYHMKDISDVVVEFLSEWIPQWENNKSKLKDKIRGINISEKQIMDSSVDSGVEIQLAKDKKIYQDILYDLENTEEYRILEKLILQWGGVNNAKFYRNYGLITIPQEVFMAMQQAGAKSGLEYRGSKDTMHFECPGLVSSLLFPVTGAAR